MEYRGNNRLGDSKPLDGSFIITSPGVGWQEDVGIGEELETAKESSI
jgi:hypothetical protein